MILKKLRRLQKAMITQYGMSEKFGLMGLASVEHEYLNGRATLNCGDATATEIDHEVMKMLKESYEQAKQMLCEHRKTLDKIAAFLIERETITGKEFMEIFHEAEGNRGKGTGTRRNSSGSNTGNTGCGTDDRSRIAGGRSNCGSCQRYTRRKESTGAGEGRLTGISDTGIKEISAGRQAKRKENGTGDCAIFLFSKTEI